jgi:hypothetical protein
MTLVVVNGATDGQLPKELGNGPPPGMIAVVETKRKTSGRSEHAPPDMPI